MVVVVTPLTVTEVSLTIVFTEDEEPAPPSAPAPEADCDDEAPADEVPDVAPEELAPEEPAEGVLAAVVADDEVLSLLVPLLPAWLADDVGADADADEAPMSESDMWKPQINRPDRSDGFSQPPHGLT